MKEGDVILTPLPQANGEMKVRPAILLRTLLPFNDWPACGISSQLHQAVANFDDLIIHLIQIFLEAELSGLQ